MVRQSFTLFLEQFLEIYAENTKLLTRVRTHTHIQTFNTSTRSCQAFWVQTALLLLANINLPFFMRCLLHHYTHTIMHTLIFVHTHAQRCLVWLIHTARQASQAHSS